MAEMKWSIEIPTRVAAAAAAAAKSLSRVRLCATPWMTAYQAPPSMGFSRQEYGSWVPSPSPITMLVLHNPIILTHNMIVLKEGYHLLK